MKSNRISISNILYSIIEVLGLQKPVPAYQAAAYAHTKFNHQKYQPEKHVNKEKYAVVDLKNNLLFQGCVEKSTELKGVCYFKMSDVTIYQYEDGLPIAKENNIEIAIKKEDLFKEKLGAA